jgi:homoserine O-acetyltransferase
LAEALRRITARAFVVAFTGDTMFPPEDCKLDAERIPNGHYRQIESDFGHLATFGLSEQDKQALDNILREVLSKQ